MCPPVRPLTSFSGTVHKLVSPCECPASQNRRSGHDVTLEQRGEGSEVRNCISRVSKGLDHLQGQLARANPFKGIEVDTDLSFGSIPVPKEKVSFWPYLCFRTLTSFVSLLVIISPIFIDFLQCVSCNVDCGLDRTLFKYVTFTDYIFHN